MADLNKFRVDAKKSAEGVWTPWLEDIELLIARQGNPKFQEFIQAERSQPKRKMTERDEADWAYANTILLGWKNVEIDGKKVPYSPKKAFELLQDPELADFRLFVIVNAQASERFRKEALEAAAKN